MKLRNDHIDILQIEDNPSRASLLRETLAGVMDIAFELHNVRSLPMALKHLAKEGADVVLLDLSLPEVGGLKAVSKVQTEAPEASIIAVVDEDNEPLAFEALRKGAQDYVVKGKWEPEVVSRSIRHAFELHEIVRSMGLTEGRQPSLVDLIPDVIVVVGPKGRIVACNSAVEQLTGYKREELKGKLFQDLTVLAPEEMPGMMRSFQSLVHENIEFPRPLVRIKHKDGTLRWVSATGRAIRVDDSTAGILAVVRDVTESRLSEEMLRQRESEYSSLIELSPDGIVLLSGTEVILANRKAKEIFGLPEFDFHGQDIGNALMTSISEVLSEMSEAERKMLLKRLEQVAAGKIEPHMYEIPVKNGLGRRLWIEISAGPIEHKGRIVELCFLRDVTERKQAQEAMRHSEERFRALIEKASDAIIILNAVGIMIYASPSVERMLGHKPEDLIGKPLSAYVHREEYDVLAIQTQGFVDDPRASEESQLRFRHSDGSWRWLGGVARNSLQDPKVQGIICNFRDITERKRWEKDLQESEERYRLLAENITDVLWTVDMNLQVTYASPSITRLLGYTVEEAMAKSMEDMLLPSSAELVKGIIVEELATEEGSGGDPQRRRSVEVELRRKDGTKGWFEISAVFLRDAEGRASGILALARDMTARKKAEDALKRSEHRLREKNRALRGARTQLSALNESLEERVEQRTVEVEGLLKQKDEFVAQLGHDLKTPLTPLMGLLPLVEKREQDPQLKEMLKVTIDNVTYMKDLVIKTLELARLNIPGMELSIDATNLREQINFVVQSRKLIIQEKEIKVRTKIDETILVKADKLRLQEVIDNLIANAVKYTPNGGILVLGAKRKKGMITISVADTGIGMTQEQIGLAFNPFYKADQSRHDLQSTGLGLAICKRIVERHGGLIWAESPGEGKGTTMYFTIPQG